MLFITYDIVWFMLYGSNVLTFNWSEIWLHYFGQQFLNDMRKVFTRHKETIEEFCFCEFLYL